MGRVVDDGISDAMTGPIKAVKESRLRTEMLDASPGSRKYAIHTAFDSVRFIGYGGDRRCFIMSFTGYPSTSRE